jgi:hypothetical protein
VGFVADKEALEQVFPRVVRFPLSISFHRCSITRKNKKKLITFITGLHNKPQGCGASIPSAAGPFTKKKTLVIKLKLKFTFTPVYPLRQIRPRLASTCYLNLHVGSYLHNLSFLLSLFSASLFARREEQREKDVKRNCVIKYTAVGEFALI